MSRELYIFILFLGDVLSEDVILKWYKEGHSTKGKSTFLEQMKKFIEWLENAEEGREKILCGEELTLLQQKAKYSYGKCIVDLKSQLVQQKAKYSYGKCIVDLKSDL